MKISLYPRRLVPVTPFYRKEGHTTFEVGECDPEPLFFNIVTLQLSFMMEELTFDLGLAAAGDSFQVKRRMGKELSSK